MVKVAAVQMCSSDNLSDNFKTAKKLIVDAAKNGAKLVVLPESFYFLGKDPHDKLQYHEEYGTGPIQEFLSAVSKANDIWLVAGTIPIKSSNVNKPYAASILFDNNGIARLQYNKIHLFDVKLSETEQYLESDFNTHGDKIEVIDTNFGRLAIVVCYDLRFLNVFEHLNQINVEIICAPAAFTYTTGKSHWEILVRGRALDTSTYIIAAAQVGKHANGRETYGNAMIVDPWGEIISANNTIVYANLDLEFQRTCKNKLAIEANTRKIL